MTLPKMKPTPMPGPTVPSPAPTPRAMAFMPASTSPVVPAWAMIGRTSAVRLTGVCSSLVVLGDCAAEVDRREGGEDERLQGRHQANLEDEEDDRDRHGQDSECGQSEDDHETAAHEQDEQVAGED